MNNYEPDDSICANTQQVIESTKQRAETRALAVKQNETKAALRIQQRATELARQAAGESARLAREKHNRNECLLFNLPKELFDEIMSYTGTGIDSMILGRVCRKFRGLDFEARFGQVTINEVDDSRTAYPNQSELRSTWLGLVHRDRLAKLIESDGDAKSYAVCGSCREAYPREAFTATELLQPPERRTCIGHSGMVRKCAHVVLHIHNDEVFANGSRLLDSSLLCQQHGKDRDITLKKQQWSSYYWKAKLKDTELAIDYSGRFSDENCIVVEWFMTCAGRNLKDMEYGIVKAMLRKNDRFVCPHTRVCDTLNSIDSLEAYDESIRLGKSYLCKQQFCLTRWLFTEHYTKRVQLRIERNFGVLRSLADPFWLSAVRLGEQKPRVRDDRRTEHDSRVPWRGQWLEDDDDEVIGRLWNDAEYD